MRQDPQRGAARLRELEHELDEALEELRSLAHGVYPPLLADRGLSDALRSVAMGSQIHVDLDARGWAGTRPRWRAPSTSACWRRSERAQARHRRAPVRVRVAAGPLGELHFSVRDDGAGMAGLRPGAGITNMQDRLAAFGGDVTVTSTPGVGTHVRGRVPASPLPVA